MEKDDWGEMDRGEIIIGRSADLEAAWARSCFLDPQEHHETFSRVVFSRGENLQSLITIVLLCGRRGSSGTGNRKE